MSLELTLRALLARYVAGRSTPAELNREIAAIRWNETAELSSDARELLDTIELAMAEYSNGDLPEDELQETFRPIAAEVTVARSSASRAVGVNASLSRHTYATTGVTHQPVVSTR